MIPLETIIYDPFARNGTWCRSPYENHPKGCPNFTKGCTAKRPDFKTIADQYDWFAVTETFDLKAHADKMKAKHPEQIKNGKVVPAWTERQCRNPLYWQGTVRSSLKRQALAEVGQLNCLGSEANGNIVLDIPEACGVNVFETMALVGVILERKPDVVIKVMLVGKKKITEVEK